MNPTTILPNGLKVELTDDQTKSLEAVKKFILSDETYFIIDGFGGTGKSTLIRKIIEEVRAMREVTEKLGGSVIPSNFYITATTNKAVDNLSSFFGDLGITASTIHSLLNLRVHTDYTKNTTHLLQSRKPDLYDSFIIVDEYTKIHDEPNNNVFDYLDSSMRYFKNCKVLFVGDRFQQTDFKGNRAYIYTKPFGKTALTETVRAREGSTIATNNHMLRKAVDTLQYSELLIDGVETVMVDSDTFLQMAIDSFKNKENAKVLAWKNKTVNYYNKTIKEHVSGNGSLQAGDSAINNFYVPSPSSKATDSLSTEEEVFITYMSPKTTYDDTGIEGNWINLSKRSRQFFLPTNQEDRKLFEKRLRANKEIPSLDKHHVLKKMDETLVDLRPVYASTVDKSQGSTYDTVFIDLDCIMSCRMLPAQTRLLYVANSRASKKVVLTGGY